jgi:LmbE family N-acetylglucosaminyl deacetylase
MTLPAGPVLGVWAHPDDEAYLSAGLMATAREAGHRVVVATASWGERGTDDPRRWPPRRLAVRRRQELATSLHAVGVSEHRHLGHADGGCRAHDPAAVEQVAALLDEVRPGLVVTFGPEGMTGHPDHQAVSTWVTAAWQATGRKAALWYATLAPDYYRDWGEHSDRLGIWVGPERPCTPHDRLAHSLRCTGRLLAWKRRALAAHASQTAALRDLVGPAVFDQWWSREWFVARA